jgi:glycerol-3-phosphate dehydrogenase subunit B
MMRVDVIVLGAGPSGLAAAVALAGTGREVRVIARGNGFTHWATGAVDVLARAGGQRVERPLDGIGSLPERHPYRVLGEDTVRQGIDAFTAFASEAGLAYEGGLDANRRQVTALGTFRSTALLPATAARPVEGRVVTVGFEGFRDFAPELCARGLRERGVDASARTVELPGWDHELHFTSVDLARAIDDQGFRARLAEKVERIVGGADVAVLPAVLGVATGQQAWADLERRIGIPIVEAALVPPSVPGMRLWVAWAAKLRSLGVRLQLGFPALGVETQAGRVSAVMTEGAARPIRNRCNELVLATGGIPGRGIESGRDGQLSEVVAGLPVASFDSRVAFFADRFLDDHPLAAAGVAVDDELRPLTAGGDLALAGVRCIGGLLADHDPIAEGSREGVAFATATRAAQVLAPATV